MKEDKEFLKQKFIEFQLKIAELTHDLHEQKDAFHTKQKEVYLSLFEILDAFENLNDTIEAAEGGFDKTTRRIVKNTRRIERKLTRLLKRNHIEQIEFPDNKARMGECKIVDTHEAPDMENETIVSVVRNGYIDKEEGSVLRKAELITVLNG